MTDEVFATAINCMDGRAQLPVINWFKRHYGVDYIDMITEPGPEKLLAEKTNQAAIESIRKRCEISVTKHHSRLVAIIGHHDCAGNPTEKETQHAQILAAIKIVESWNLDIRIVGLRIDENWQVYEVK